MKTAEERIKKLHKRAAELKRQRDKRYLTGFGSASVFLAVMLAVAIMQTDELFHSVTDGEYVGSSLLSESTGAYVLVAVAAFFIGVIITAVLIRYRRK